jgi:hypothetical protein
MAFFVAIILLAIFLLTLLALARSTTHMLAAHQIALTRLHPVAFASGEPSIFTPFATRSQSSSLKLFSSRCSAALPGSRPGEPSTSFLRVFSVCCHHLAATPTRDHLIEGVATSLVVFVQRLSDLPFSSLVERVAAIFPNATGADRANRRRRGGPSLPVATVPLPRTGATRRAWLGYAQGNGGPSTFGTST